MFISGCALIGYSLAIASFARFGEGNVLLIALGLPLLLFGLFWKPLCAWTSLGLGAAVLFALRAGYALFALLLLVCTSFMASANAETPAPGADAVVVLGAGLRGESVSLTLKLRLDAALAYMESNPDALCVLSGGQGADELISEAEAMRRYMVNANIDESRLLLEDRSQNTAQNIAFSRALLIERFHREPDAVIVTSDFHLYRGVSLARGAGFIEPGGIGGRSEPYLLPLYTVREVFGIAKDFIMGRFG